MKYRFIVHYTATNIAVSTSKTCFPLYSDDLAVSIEREEGEWYYTRRLDGKLSFVKDDYDYLMRQPFDGTFELTIKESHDNGSTWHDYFVGSFSIANMEIDQDNRTASLNNLKEGVADLIKNGKNEDYDLMKLIPDSYAKEVQGQVPPALAMVDYRSDDIEHSDVFCGGPATGNGYKAKEKTGFSTYERVTSDSSWRYMGAKGECKIKMRNGSSDANGCYGGNMSYGAAASDSPTFNKISLSGTMYASNGYRVVMDFIELQQPTGYTIAYRLKVYDTSSSTPIIQATSGSQGTTTDQVFTPVSFVCEGSLVPSGVEKIEVQFHYIRATLLTQSADGVQENVLDTGDYYKGMSAFNNNDGGLIIEITANTSDQPNGHRMVPGTDEYGGIPQYFAPPDESGDWIPLAESNWNYASMWYKITPSVANGLIDPTKFGTFRWTRCWTIGCCIMHLLKRITNDKVVFAESPNYSQFLYSAPNPVEGHEAFQWLVTQKSNVMHPANTGAARCIVRLDWFLELLHNAFNCYYWFERRNDGRYDFRIEHVEYFRRGGAYNGDLAERLDLTRLKPVRNFLRSSLPAKTYADQTNKYSFDLDNMTEKYTSSWQGDGGSDDFKGNPMFFKAGWIEKGTSEDRQVDNIFADLGWLMLNAGTDTASSKNYDGLFIFGGYRAFDPSQWTENSPAAMQYINDPSFANISLCLTIPAGYTVTTEKLNTLTQAVETIATYHGTGEPQMVVMTFSQGQSNILPRVNFDPYNDQNISNIIIHRIHDDMSGNIYRVPNLENLLRPTNYIQNGCLAWPWLQTEYLHYDIPASQWSYDSDDIDQATFLGGGTIKMVKKQTLGIVPLPDASTEQYILDIMAVKTGLGIGIIDNARINLSSRNAEMTIIYDINPQNNQ